MLTEKLLNKAKKTYFDGGVIVYPTESVYGLGCNPNDESAVMRLLAIKKRDVNKGLIVIASHVQQILPLIAPSNPQDLSRALKTWPGHHTWVFRKSKLVPHWISGDFDTIALRVSKHPVVVQLLNHINQPMVSTSANISSHQTLNSVKSIAAEFGDKIQLYLDLPTGDEENPSQIHDAATNKIIR